ncbi:MAG: NAD(P)-dependent dehydrogenase (short-subunit alcohol dehydrogenase family) [Alphaproteobacteria bacterium]|jgi:NAD(P)-dependent dehydrogenase (short-subunit alcohol dehydrogenase family)
MTIRFDNRVAIVTGAGHGLGRSYALALAARGAKVVVNDIGGAIDGSGGSQTPAEAVVAEIAAAGGEAVANYDSVADRASAANIVATAVDAFGTVDILINNAGIVRDKSFHKIALDDYEFVVQVHLMGSVYVTHAAFPIMREKDYGRILMVTSSAGIYGNFGQSNYGAAKMGVVGLMNTLKVEAARNNIKINTMAPLAATRIAEPSGIFDEYDASLVTPDAVAAMATYLVSEDCTDTGNIIAATAGYYSKVHIVESDGIHLDPRAPVTPEQLGEKWDQITQLRDPKPYFDAVEHLRAKMAKE